MSVISLLNEPNTESPANVDAAKEFNENRNAYWEKVKKLLKDEERAKEEADE
ncbi:hypothetical protein C0991_003382 [Blastosporella zonata]|nr:hypothetical protein C0991_003382 [Blastosporella zonata]